MQATDGNHRSSRSEPVTKSRVIAAVGALVVVLVFMIGRTTGAYWSDSENLGAGTVDSGTLTLLNGNESSQVKNYDFAALSATNLAPGRFAQAPLTMKNGGSADLRYQVQNLTSNPAAFKGQVTAAYTVVASASGCPATGSGAQPGSPVTLSSPRALAPGATEVLCIRVTLADSAPQNQPNQRLTFNFFGEQNL